MSKTEMSCRRNRVGGEAVLEGVMMKAGEQCATACRLESGDITVTKQKFVSVRKKNKLLNLPIIRGVVNFVEMMKLSLASLNVSADAMGLNDEDEETKFEKWMKKHLGLRLTDALMVIAMVLGVGLALFLFMFLPSLAASGLQMLFGSAVTPFYSLIEGAVKILIFVSYIWLVALMPDIRRTFQYHGAEHKSIACFESGDALTPENAKRHTRFHPRCGTSFMFVMILLGIIIGFFVPASLPPILRAAVKILLLPVVMGLGYEFIMFAGKHDSLFIRALSAPGLLMQRLTTREPDEQQLEVAITALKCAMIEEFPDFDTSHLTIKDLDTGDVTDPKKPENATETSEENAAVAPDEADESAPKNDEA